jgi:exopolyphosphatase/guanosine-5'-triphosphate,3'-diphosphate pyrophosphatase
MSKKVAVMDLGTNTFHLLIAEGDAANPTILFKTTEPTKIGEGGINKGVIVPEAYERGMKAMRAFKKQIDDHGVAEVKALATSAMRSASNGHDFINQVKNETGIAIHIIDGDEEASYIYQGVRASGCLTDKNSLIIDIGGGSIEFILCNKDTIVFKQSFEIGAARMMDKFHRTDPIDAASIAKLHQFLDEALISLFTIASRHRIHNLVGSSGSFETFASIAGQQQGNLLDIAKTKTYVFKPDEFIKATDYLIGSTHQQRAENKEIAPVRVDMIVVSSLITRFVMDKLSIHDVTMTTNSLKEGVLVELLCL